MYAQYVEVFNLHHGHMGAYKSYLIPLSDHYPVYRYSQRKRPWAYRISPWQLLNRYRNIKRVLSFRNQLYQMFANILSASTMLTCSFCITYQHKSICMRLVFLCCVNSLYRAVNEFYAEWEISFTSLIHLLLVWVLIRTSLFHTKIIKNTRLTLEQLYPSLTNPKFICGDWGRGWRSATSGGPLTSLSE